MPSKPFRTPVERLEDIRDNIDAALRFVADMTFEQFVDDQKTTYAVIRALEVISEASRHVPEEIKQRFPEAGWRDIAASGNIFRHFYQGVNLRVVWQTAQNDLAPLRRFVVAELARLGG
jgi:uncharacterized protein with HEPN domain